MDPEHRHRGDHADMAGRDHADQARAGGEAARVLSQSETRRTGLGTDRADRRAAATGHPGRVLLPLDPRVGTRLWRAVRHGRSALRATGAGAAAGAARRGERWAALLEFEP